MLKADSILQKWASSVDLAKSRIINFPSYIFLCGGQLSSQGDNCFKSCRDIFYSYVERQNDIVSQNIVLAEDIIKLFDESGYPDLLTFEKDLAAISLLTIIFSESPGAIAELGSFSVLDNIRDRLFLVMHEDYAKNKKSFIWKGPVRYLKAVADKNNNSNPVYVYNWEKDFNLKNISSESAFSDASDLYQEIKAFVGKRKKSSTWNRSDVGHIMLLVVSSLDVMQIATIEELRRIMQYLQLNDYAKHMERYLNMLTALELIGIKHYGNIDYYVSKMSGKEWLQFIYKEKENNFLWNAKFVSFYKKNQENKVKAWKSYHRNDS